MKIHVLLLSLLHTLKADDGRPDHLDYAMHENREPSVHTEHTPTILHDAADYKMSKKFS